MTEEQTAAFINSQVACAQIEAMGMVAENMQRQALGQSMAYGEDSFADVIVKYGISHNQVIETLRDIG